jgi:hypothetical protein
MPPGDRWLVAVIAVLLLASLAAAVYVFVTQ